MMRDIYLAGLTMPLLRPNLEDLISELLDCEVDITIEEDEEDCRCCKCNAQFPEITNVVFNDPATIVFWDDGTKTVVKCQKGDVYSKESGLAIAIAKKAFGNKNDFNRVFNKWLYD